MLRCEGADFGTLGNRERLLAGLDVERARGVGDVRNLRVVWLAVLRHHRRHHETRCAGDQTQSDFHMRTSNGADLMDRAFCCIGGTTFGKGSRVE